LIVVCVSPPLSQPPSLLLSSVVVVERGVVTKGGIVAEHYVVAERGVVVAHVIVTKLGVVAKRCGVVIILAAIDNGVTTKQHFMGVGLTDPTFVSNYVTPLGSEGLRDDLGVVAKRRGVIAECAIAVTEHDVVAKLGVVAEQRGVVAELGIVITKCVLSGVLLSPRLALLPKCGVGVAKRAPSGMALLPSGMAL
jgi:hypothetical protein